jgi:hypothetical protein
MPCEAWLDPLDCDLSVVKLRSKCSDHALDPQCLRQSFKWRREGVGSPSIVRLESVNVFANRDPCRLAHKSRSFAKDQVELFTAGLNNKNRGVELFVLD